MNSKRFNKRISYHVLASLALALSAFFALLLFVRADQVSPAELSLVNAAPMADPTSVTLVGDLQPALGVGCGEWTVDCTASHLTEQGYGVWRGVFTVTTPTTTTWEYKMAMDDSWDE
ncbi:MAG: hypothetical protein SXV54_11385, partial [Chloroflexota bacterium]|nr:hypothetical protein [Chloroflexota bacterium]